MQASRLRVEIIRFGLLIVLTLGLFSVAARAFDDDDARPGALGASPAATAPGSSATPGADPTDSPDPADGADGDGSGTGDGSGSGDLGTESGSGGSGGGAIAAQELPRTGPDTALRLTGLALVLIAGGGLSLAGARRSG